MPVNSPSPELVQFLVIGLLMERLGLTEISIPWQEVLWGMSGTNISIHTAPNGDVRVSLTPIGNFGIPGAAPVCPWPASHTASPEVVAPQGLAPIKASEFHREETR